ncbi:LOW QUALITY PROTEIN: potassium channel subfamily K member 17-like [Petaurus breviceps papuanus]|uniref:LOW QUALITY PROTEIN: potassium channel subfamily K member 17-like n=1 Tax=Petaurus breviceps papuanus TaxID=3040969 RepID=UPI0036D9B338
MMKDGRKQYSLIFSPIFCNPPLSSPFLGPKTLRTERQNGLVRYGVCVRVDLGYLLQLSPIIPTFYCAPGYGNLSPQTMGARLFCIFFAFLGIPLNLVLLNRLGRLMLSWVQRWTHWLGEAQKNQARARWFAGSCAFLSGLLMFFLLPPLLFSHMEGWSYEEGFYYSFITLSTVGFGDYVIGMNPDRKYPIWYKNVVSMWILFGMAWLALIINLVISLMENSTVLCTCSLRYPCRTGDPLETPSPTNQRQHLETLVESPPVVDNG